MAASISTGTTGERLGQQLKDLLRSGQYEELHLLLESQRMSHPDDRELRLYQLLFVAKAEGVATHEREIESLRNLSELSDREREIIRQILILGFEEAQREGIKEKAWAYQRLARRLILRQSLIESLPVVACNDAEDSERREQAADDSLKSPARLSRGPNAHGGVFAARQNLLGSALPILAGVALAAVLANYAPMIWNQSRIELPERKDPSNEKAANTTAVSKPHIESATATREGLESGNAPGIAATELIEHRVVRATEVAPKAGRLAHNQAKVSSTNQGRNQGKNISATTAGIRVGEVKVSRVSPVSNPREKPATEGPASQPRDEAGAAVLATYQARIDVRLRQEPRYGSPRGMTIKKGTVISGMDLNRDWLRIKVPSDGSTGFVRKEFVVPVSSTEPR